MPVFRFRLEAQDKSGHFREGRIAADSKKKAQLALEEREFKFARLELPDERIAELLAKYVDPDVAAPAADASDEERAAFRGRLDELPKAPPAKASEEEKAEFRALHVRDRSHLNLHRQSEPYKLVSLKEEG